MKNEIGLLSSVADEFNIKVFGKKINDIAFTASKTNVFKNAESKPVLVKVYGTKLLEKCVALSKPFYLILPDNGVKPDGCGIFGDPNEYLMWIFPRTESLVKLSVEIGMIEQMITEIVHPFLDVNADFHIHDFKVEGTKLSGKLKAYLHLHQSGPFGTTLLDITLINGDYSFSIDLIPTTCVNVFSIGIASAQICFYDNPNRICGTVDVSVDLPIIGHWGRKFDIACVKI